MFEFEIELVSYLNGFSCLRYSSDDYTYCKLCIVSHCCISLFTTFLINCSFVSFLLFIYFASDLWSFLLDNSDLY